MDSVRNTLSSGAVGIIFRFILFLVALYALYKIYQFLYYSESIYQSNRVINGIQYANITTPVIKPITGVNLADGGDFSVNMWVYIKNLGKRAGAFQQIFSIMTPSTSADDVGYHSVLVYTGPYSNTLFVRAQTQPNGAAVTSALEYNNNKVESMFNQSFSTESQVNSDYTTPCDIKNIDLQKWVQVTITYSAKTLDVYMDGKLARSCVLPSYIKFAGNGKVNNYAVGMKGGYEGYLSNVEIFDYTLNPEQVWRKYMAGPGPELGILDYFKVLFDPKGASSINFPKNPTA